MIFKDCYINLEKETQRGMRGKIKKEV